jgi:hypothetical protein
MDEVERKYRDPEAKNKMKDIKKQVYFLLSRHKDKFKEIKQFFESLLIS